MVCGSTCFSATHFPSSIHHFLFANFRLLVVVCQSLVSEIAHIHLVLSSTLLPSMKSNRYKGKGTGTGTGKGGKSKGKGRAKFLLQLVHRWSYIGLHLTSPFKLTFSSFNLAFSKSFLLLFMALPSKSILDMGVVTLTELRLPDDTWNSVNTRK